MSKLVKSNLIVLDCCILVGQAKPQVRKLVSIIQPFLSPFSQLILENSVVLLYRQSFFQTAAKFNMFSDLKSDQKNIFYRPCCITTHHTYLLCLTTAFHAHLALANKLLLCSHDCTTTRIKLYSDKNSCSYQCCIPRNPNIPGKALRVYLIVEIRKLLCIFSINYG